MNFFEKWTELTLLLPHQIKMRHSENHWVMAQELRDFSDCYHLLPYITLAFKASLNDPSTLVQYHPTSRWMKHFGRQCSCNILLASFEQALAGVFLTILNNCACKLNYWQLFWISHIKPYRENVSRCQKYNNAGVPFCAICRPRIFLITYSSGQQKHALVFPQMCTCALQLMRKTERDRKR